MGDIALLRQDFVRPRRSRGAPKRAKAEAAVADLFDDAVEASPPPRAAPAGARDREAPLGCLAGAALAPRFHSWRGASGRRYICSVFPVREDAELGGLPEFDDAIALAVSRDGRGRRRRVAVLDLSWRDGRFAGDIQAAGEALGAGACEWHIHLLAEDGEARRAAIADIAS
ncbi:hypothetical protein [Methylocella sp.]|jgi:hypothetical protein|uniref:hypothetical protein n=1 Tax=Methylocella sp. TaxID=1978226 RepID=UPI003C2699D8